MVAFVNFVDFGVFVAAVDSGQKCIINVYMNTCF